MRDGDDRLDAWMEALEARHTTALSFREVRRGLQALSAIYVERRHRIGEGAVFDGAGKRAAFAMAMAPLHFVVVREIVRGAGLGNTGLRRIVDLGCGTGAAAGAWALECGAEVEAAGIDRNAWAVEEARWNWGVLGVRGRARVGDLATERLPGSGSGIVAAFAVNELGDAVREGLLGRLLEASRKGAVVLVVEPIARRAFPWWGDWAAAFREVGGQDETWRFRVPLPERLRALDEAAGLDHREQTARTLILRRSDSASAFSA